ncbi:MAG TPA: methyl-accepting chemotaxis protein, partial [Caulobacteraceae bacterium]|nr:methyl-accepting chemotaxis protein [Caulobacteraceae bacterium]
AEMDEMDRRQREVQAEADRKRADEQVRVVEALAAGLSALAAGQLSLRLETPFPEGYDAVRLDFNRSIAELESAMAIIATTSRSLDQNAIEVAEAVGNLSTRTERQASDIEETALALQRVTAAVAETANGMRQAGQVAASARLEADRSNEVVDSAIRAMGDIETSSDKIGQIVTLIDEIAFQTNLLALNAGVEAARAGDAGRGFAVVAQEVRALSQRSAEAAKEIRGLIDLARKHVALGVDLVGRTGEALQHINGEVGQINELVSQIATSTRGQAMTLDEVTRAVGQIEKITQQNSAMVEETTAAAEVMAGDVRTLDSLIGRFEVHPDDTAGEIVTLRRAG